MKNKEQIEHYLNMLYQSAKWLRTAAKRQPPNDSRRIEIVRGWMLYCADLADAIGWLTTFKASVSATTLVRALGVAQEQIEEALFQSTEEQVASMLSNNAPRFKVKRAEWRRDTIKVFRERTKFERVTDAGHGGLTHAQRLLDTGETGTRGEYPVHEQESVVRAAFCTIVALMTAFNTGPNNTGTRLFFRNRAKFSALARGKLAGTGDPKIGRAWSCSYKNAALEKARVPIALARTTKRMDLLWDRLEGVWEERPDRNDLGGWRRYWLGAAWASYHLGEGIRMLLEIGLYGPAFTLARAQWEAAAMSHSLLNEMSDDKLEHAFRFAKEDGRIRPRIPTEGTTWRHEVARGWAETVWEHKRALSELAKGHAVYAQRAIRRMGDSDQSDFSNGELRNLGQFAEVNMLFVRCSYQEFEDSMYRQEFIDAASTWRATWPTYIP